jgi:hypothetical protein
VIEGGPVGRDFIQFVNVDTDVFYGSDADFSLLDRSIKRVGGGISCQIPGDEVNACWRAF